MTTTAAAPSVIFVLGSIDPEMLTIMRALHAAGVPWRWASTPAGRAAAAEKKSPQPGDGTRPVVAPAAAYAADDVAALEGATRVWVECRPAGMTRAAVEARGDVVVDHHDAAQDPAASCPPERAVEASSVGQLGLLAWVAACGQRVGGRRPGPEAERVWAALLREVQAPPRGEGFKLSPAMRVAGALDHALGAALGGLVPGVDPDDCLRAAAVMAADRELAELKGTPPEAETPEAYLAQVAAAQEILRAAPRIALGYQRVCDLLGHAGKIPALPVAAAHARLAYVIEVPGRPGVPATCSIGGAATPEAVEEFATFARGVFEAQRAFAARRRDAAAVAAMDACANQGAAKGGVYAFPQRGMAGVYLPAATFGPSLRYCALRAAMERALADHAAAWEGERYDARRRLDAACEAYAAAVIAGWTHMVTTDGRIGRYQSTRGEGWEREFLLRMEGDCARSEWHFIEHLRATEW